ncbi:MAG: hypothetical protein QM541_12600 [Flavobacterium sp.]|nr:hypothetical protein [Flavobacterium sp.]
MKNKLKELNVDSIGGQAPLTKEEELVISAFIKANKEKLKIGKSRKTARLKSALPA